MAIGSGIYLAYNIIALIRLLDLASQNSLTAKLLEGMILDKAVNIVFGSLVLIFSISSLQWSKQEHRKILELDGKIKKITQKIKNIYRKES